MRKIGQIRRPIHACSNKSYVSYALLHFNLGYRGVRKIRCSMKYDSPASHHVSTQTNLSGLRCIIYSHYVFQLQHYLLKTFVTPIRFRNFSTKFLHLSQLTYMFAAFYACLCLGEFIFILKLESPLLDTLYFQLLKLYL